MRIYLSQLIASHNHTHGTTATRHRARRMNNLHNAACKDTTPSSSVRTKHASSGNTESTETHPPSPPIPPHLCLGALTKNVRIQYSFATGRDDARKQGSDDDSPLSFPLRYYCSAVKHHNHVHMQQSTTESMWKSF